jgi:hypothetical protein
MATRWVLDTQTKGTGATMVPLERVLKKGSDTVEGFRLPDRKARTEAPEAPRPHKFKVVDVLSRQVLAEDVDARGAVSALSGVRSVVDVDIYVWDLEDERWRMLSFAQRRTLWEHRDGAGANQSPRG